METLSLFWQNTGIYNLTSGNVIMMVIGIIFISLAIRKDYEPLLLCPIGFGIVVGNIPPVAGMALGYNEFN
ncbi:MAG: sodium ion-translocating decarboxylase subunit beta, partial [Planctomycetota bacterium]|nr:sodium ion-translocating decarboxylase subunit beta [Planctomycetota bacterium]